jgi:hypothetical protein
MNKAPAFLSLLAPLGVDHKAAKQTFAATVGVPAFEITPVGRGLRSVDDFRY